MMKTSGGIADLIAQQRPGQLAKAPGLPAARAAATPGFDAKGLKEAAQNGQAARKAIDGWMKPKEELPLPPDQPPPPETPDPGIGGTGAAIPAAPNAGIAAAVPEPQAPPPLPPAPPLPEPPPAPARTPGVAPAAPAAGPQGSPGLAPPAPLAPAATPAPAEGLAGTATGLGGATEAGAAAGGSGLTMAALRAMIGFAQGGIAAGTEPFARGGTPGIKPIGVGSRGGTSHFQQPGGGLFRGAVKGGTPGRADARTMSVGRGSYVVPADVVSGLGAGNTDAGFKHLAGPLSKRGPIAYANGGVTGERADPVPVRLSDGEYVYSPEEVAALGDGDPRQGAAKLDALVHSIRASTVDQLKRMPPPK